MQVAPWSVADEGMVVQIAEATTPRTPVRAGAGAATPTSIAAANTPPPPLGDGEEEVPPPPPGSGSP